MQVNTVTLKDISFMPELGLKLIYVRALDKLEFKIHFGNDLVWIMKEGIVSATGSLISTNLYILDIWYNSVAVNRSLYV